MTYLEAINEVLDIYAEERPDRDSELSSMGVYQALDAIAKELDEQHSREKHVY